MKKAIVLSLLATCLYGCSGGETEPGATAGGTGSAASKFSADVWVDNWFSAYVGETQAAEDAVPITTERSFNKTSFTFEASYPFDLNVVIKDYKASDSGLEYIGTPQQQMGDGGFIGQIKDSAGKVVAVSSSAWKCKVIQKAPLNTECEKDADPNTTCKFESSDEPAGWKASGYDVSAWEASTEYTAAAVGVKDGYNEVTWDAAAKLIWTQSLKQDNTLLCKFTVKGS